MEINGIRLDQIDEMLWEIPRSGLMNAPGRIYASRRMIEESVQNAEAVQQVVNVACLPGIVKFSLAMPDIHWGYGFPIGGIAATSIDEGVISPGGVGYDINCGVRLACTSLEYEPNKKKIKELIDNLFNDIPAGIGSSGAIKKLSLSELKKILTSGAEWAVKNNFGNEDDLLFTEENGRLKNAEPTTVSAKAMERGLDQAGTLGSGNHFLEVDVVEEIFDSEAASAFSLFKGQVVVLIHTGSRGLGYQICDDYLKLLLKEGKKFGFNLPDRQLACAPVKSDEGESYLSAMKCAANFAWNNRQIIMHLAKKSFIRTFGISEEELGFKLLYDVSHNIAKIEEHNIHGMMKKVCVHRKGATRAFPAGNPDIPAQYRNTGQPVLIPGDMGRCSYISVGRAKSMDETFGSSCHGAGRLQSRNQALKEGKGRDLINELKGMGVVIQAKGMKTIAEEMPFAYKNVSEVVDVMHISGISTRVAKLKPAGVIKG